MMMMMMMIIYIYIYPLSRNISWRAQKYFRPIYVYVSKAVPSLVFTYHIDSTTKNIQITQCCYICALQKNKFEEYMLFTQ